MQQNAARIAPALALAIDIGRGCDLDGFVVELRDVAGIERSALAFGRVVKELLVALCDLEENGCRCMRGADMGDFGWWFEFG